MNELFGEFYDENTTELTDQTKSISPNEKVSIEDKIIAIDYNSDEDYTTFKFNSDYSTLDYHNVIFNGNHTDNYHVSDFLKFNLKLVQTDNIDGEVFVDLDYNIHVEQTGEFPELDTFIE